MVSEEGEVCELHTELCLCPLKSGGGGQWQDNSWFHLFAMCNYGCFLWKYVHSWAL